MNRGNRYATLLADGTSGVKGTPMKNFGKFLQTHPKVMKGIILGYIIFAGCFVFPFGNKLFPFDLMKAYLVIVSYGVIGLGFAGVWGEKKGKTVYFFTLLFTAMGMLGRYLLEYGEVSNTLNFTPANVISYLVIIPVYCTIAYRLLVQYLKKKGL